MCFPLSTAPPPAEAKYKFVFIEIGHGAMFLGPLGLKVSRQYEHITGYEMLWIK